MKKSQKACRKVMSNKVSKKRPFGLSPIHCYWFLYETFLGNFFAVFITGFDFALYSAFFLPILIFREYFCGVRKELFGNFGTKFTSYRSKYGKMIFLQTGPRILF